MMMMIVMMMTINDDDDDDATDYVGDYDNHDNDDRSGSA